MELAGVGTLVLFKELEHATDSLSVKLTMDAVEIFRFVFPEINLNQRIWILSAFQDRLGILLQYISNLLSPCDNGTLEHMGLIF